MKCCQTKRRRAFTIIELLIVIAIIGILAALLFPAFNSARESSRRASCTSNLHQIGLAVQMYRLEEREFPTSLAVLLPASTSTASQSVLDNSSGPTGNVLTPAVAVDNSNCGTDPATSTCPNPGGTGYFQALDSLRCLDDFSGYDKPHSSYGDLSTLLPPRQATPSALRAPITEDNLSRYLWNFWGYRADGTAYANESEAASENSVPPEDPPEIVNPQLVDPTQPYHTINRRANVIKHSMSNRFAPANTVVTYCPYHLAISSEMNRPENFYDPLEPAANKIGARALILRLDGSTKSLNVSDFGVTQKWQNQNF